MSAPPPHLGQPGAPGSGGEGGRLNHAVNIPRGSKVRGQEYSRTGARLAPRQEVIRQIPFLLPVVFPEESVDWA